MLAFFCACLRNGGVDFSPISSVSPVEDSEDLEEIFFPQKKETIALGVVDEVVKKASTLTANGVPASAGRSLFRGLAFLSTVPEKVTLSRQRLLSLRQLKPIDMEKYNQIQYVIGRDDLKEILIEIIDERIDLIVDKWFEAKRSEGLVSTENAMQLLDVSKTTLWRWKQRGYLVPVRIGGIDRYRLRDIKRILEG